MSAKDTPRVFKSPIFLDTNQGLQTVVANIFSSKSQIVDRDIRVLPVADIESLELMVQEQQQQIALPVIGINMVNIDPNEASFNTHVMRKHGFQTVQSATNDSWVMFKARPVVVTYQVMFLTDDFEHMLKMVDRWESIEVWGFKLRVSTVDNFDVKIKVVPDKSVSIPPRAQDSAGAQKFRLTTNLKVETYCGFIWLVPSIKELSLDVNVLKNSAKMEEIASGKVPQEDFTNAVNKSFVFVEPDPVY